MSRVTGWPEAICKAPCVCATTANITLSGAQTIDGVAVVADDRVIVKDQTDTTENGLYVAATGAWTRATDANESADLTSGVMVVDINQDIIYEITFTGTFTADTTVLTFTEYGGNSATYFKLNDADDRTITGDGNVLFSAAGTLNGIFNNSVTVTGGTFQIGLPTSSGASSRNTWLAPGLNIGSDGDSTTGNIDSDTSTATFTGSGGITFHIDDAGNFNFGTKDCDFNDNDYVLLKSYTTSELTTLGAGTAGRFAYCSDHTNQGGNTGAITFDDGTNWVEFGTSPAVNIV